MHKKNYFYLNCPANLVLTVNIIGKGGLSIKSGQKVRVTIRLWKMLKMRQF